MSDYLDKLANNSNGNKAKQFKKQLNKTTTPDQSDKKKKTIRIDYSLYKKLKIASAMKDEQIGQLANIGLRYCFNHNVYK